MARKEVSAERLSELSEVMQHISSRIDRLHLPPDFGFRKWLAQMVLTPFVAGERRGAIRELETLLYELELGRHRRHASLEEIFQQIKEERLHGKG